MTDSKAIAAVVVLYHPGSELIENLYSYLPQVGVLFAIDNSEVPDRSIAEQLSAIEKVIYITNGKNLGIAQALNIGAEKAISIGCDFLLTMDQDSYASEDMIERLVDCQLELDSMDIGIISPFHMTQTCQQPNKSSRWQEVMTPMTSGCLVSLDAYRKVGPFLDKFFIDFVDNIF